MGYELTGKIKTVMEPMTFESGFKKREFVVTSEDQYPQDVKFEMVKGKDKEKDPTTFLDTLNEGDEVTVHFDIRGNEYKDRYYVNLNAWRVEKLGETKATPASQPETTQAGGEDDEDQPF